MNEPRFPMTTLLTVAAITLITGTIAGAIAGGITGKSLVDENPAVVMVPQPTPKTAKGSPTATVKPTRASERSSGGPTPTSPVAIATAAPVDGQPGGTISTAIADIVAKVNPAVVTVINKQSFAGFFNDGADLQPVGTGTGFIISADGYIVTNHHVVENSQGLDVIFDNDTKVEAHLIGSDPFTDLAVVKVDVEVPGVVPIGDSNVLRPGDPVVAIGSALGSYTNTVTDGVISGMDRRLINFDGSSMEDMIQHDAPINPGNSGGPLLNFNGEVIGVNTAVVRWADRGIYADGLGFAISSETLRQIVDVLIRDGAIERPYLGINSALVTPAIADWYELPVQNGAYVTDVASGGPAERAGIKKGDIITKINETVLDQANPFVNVLFRYRPGDVVAIEVFRELTNETITFEMTLATRPDIP
jgi:2-alkenal reductase